MIEAGYAFGLSVAAIAIAWLVHTRVVGWLPEDAPGGSRKRHRRPIPMAGFVPALLAGALCVADGRFWLAAGCALAAGIGVLDDATKRDRDGVDWRVKALALAAASGLATAGIAFRTAPDAASLAAIAVSIFVMTNAANFLDNTDGVAASLGGIALVLVGGDATALGALWLAFVPFNWPAPRLFLGDGGALPLGLVAGTFAAGAAVDGGSLDVVAAVAPVAVLWADFVQVVIARLVLGFAPWVGDRRHLTHIVQALGLPRVAVAPLFAALALAAGLSLARP